MNEILEALARALDSAPEFLRCERIEGENAIGFEYGDGGELFFLEVQTP